MASERKKILMHPDPFCDNFLVSKVAIIDATDEFVNFGHDLSIANVQNRSAKSRARDHLMNCSSIDGSSHSSVRSVLV